MNKRSALQGLTWVAAGTLMLGCSKEPRVYSPPQSTGGPAYWESSVPEDAPRTQQGTQQAAPLRDWPAGEEGIGGGASDNPARVHRHDRMLWDDSKPSPDVPESSAQEPLREHASPARLRE